MKDFSNQNKLICFKLNLKNMTALEWFLFITGVILLVPCLLALGVIWGMNHCMKKCNKDCETWGECTCVNKHEIHPTNL
jgi:hypothetical protein